MIKSLKLEKRLNASSHYSSKFKEDSMTEPKMKFQIINVFKEHRIISKCDKDFSQYDGKALLVVREDNCQGIFIPALDLFFLSEV